jgi:hypothetical protein
VSPPPLIWAIAKVSSRLRASTTGFT